MVNQRRRFTRTPTEMLATIVHHRIGKESCIVRDISAGGACIEPISSRSLPDRFVLTIHPLRFSCPCSVAWRRDERVGVAFVASPSSISM
jgi:hypothetical protein